MFLGEFLLGVVLGIGCVQIIKYSLIQIEFMGWEGQEIGNFMFLCGSKNRDIYRVVWGINSSLVIVV